MDPLLKYQGEPNDIPIPILSSSSSTYYVGQSLFITVQHQVVEATVRYIGPISRQKPGEWVGLELTQPLGKNDGSYNGQRYFSCAMKHGLFRHIDEVHPPEGRGQPGEGKNHGAQQYPQPQYQQGEGAEHQIIQQWVYDYCCCGSTTITLYFETLEVIYSSSCIFGSKIFARADLEHVTSFVAAHQPVPWWLVFLTILISMALRGYPDQLGLDADSDWQPWIPFIIVSLLWLLYLLFCRSVNIFFGIKGQVDPIPFSCIGAPERDFDIIEAAVRRQQRILVRHRAE